MTSARGSTGSADRAAAGRARRTRISEPFLGEIRRWPQGPVPEGWQRCDGHELAIAEHPELFAVFGTEFGGDGTSTFALPSLTGAEDPSDQFAVATHQHPRSERLPGDG